MAIVSTLGLGLIYTFLMFLAITHINIFMERNDDLDSVAWPNAVAAVLFLFLAYLIPSTTYAATSETEINARLNSTFELLLQELPKLENKQQAEELIRRHILPITDTNKSAMLMLGKHWRQASDSQRRRFTNAMTNNLISTYAAFLLDKEATKAKFDIVRITASETTRGTKYTIFTTVTIDRPVEVIFIAYQPTGKDWKLIDVSVEGISMTLNWRSTFSNMIHSSGDLEQVITDLENNQVHTKE